MSVFTALHQQAEAWLGKRLFRLFRYLISGGTAAATNVGILFLLVQFWNFHYLQASITAYLLAIVVSFTLQKFWTFQDRPTHDVHAQFFRYVTVVLANLALNTALMYVFVSTMHIWYIFAQILAIAIIAVTGYFGYKYFVFVERTTP
jgi:putative flippase GtrA